MLVSPLSRTGIVLLYWKYGQIQLKFKNERIVLRLTIQNHDTKTKVTIRQTAVYKHCINTKDLACNAIFTKTMVTLCLSEGVISRMYHPLTSIQYKFHDYRILRKETHFPLKVQEENIKSIMTSVRIICRLSGKTFNCLQNF